MDKRKKKRLLNYIIYSLFLATIFAFVSPLITRYVPNENEIFNWQVFTSWLFTILLIALLVAFFPKFKKKGSV